MYFSEYFDVEKQEIEDYGAIDISLVCDIPLFIDPMLIFNSKKPEYVNLHKQIIQYFHFLAKKSDSGFNSGDLSTYFDFSEIKNNWLGYSKSSNEGNGNGENFSRLFAENIKFSLQTHEISSGTHFEKAMLLFKGSGRDKISDLTTRLILDYLATYTQKFALDKIDKRFRRSFILDSKFDYNSETFESIEYTLPFIENRKGNYEFVLLTPKDILRKEEPTLNQRDLIRSYDKVRNVIDNAAIRSQLENYISKAVAAYEKECQAKKKKAKESTIARIERQAFIETLQYIPELYDYYIKLKESEKEQITEEALNETTEQLEKFYINSLALINLHRKNFPKTLTGLSAQEEAKQRLIGFKHIIEHCDGYKNLYYNGQPISKEDDLQRLFCFAWYGSKYYVNYETNNGHGESNVKLSYGAKEKNFVEYKLASNSRLSHFFDQVNEQDNHCHSLFAIFYFSQNELLKVKNMLVDTKTERLIDDSIFLIDCRNDNKNSASV